MKETYQERDAIAWRFKSTAIVRGNLLTSWLEPHELVVNNENNFEMDLGVMQIGEQTIPKTRKTGDR